jgi:hypothetical protein
MQTLRGLASITSPLDAGLKGIQRTNWDEFYSTNTMRGAVGK